MLLCNLRPTDLPPSRHTAPSSSCSFPNWSNTLISFATSWQQPVYLFFPPSPTNFLSLLLPLAHHLQNLHKLSNRPSQRYSQGGIVVPPPNLLSKKKKPPSSFVPHHVLLSLLSCAVRISLTCLHRPFTLRKFAVFRNSHATVYRIHQPNSRSR